MKKKGILLVTTLIFLGVIIMLCSVIAYNGKSVLMSGSGYADSEQAYMAAMSGIDFIREQLAENKNYGKPDFFSGENKKNGQSDSDANEDKDVCFLNYQDIFKVGVNKRKNLIIGFLAPSLSVDKTAFKAISSLRDINLRDINSIDSRAKFIISFDSQNDYLSPRSINNFDNEAPQEADLNGNKSEVPPNTFYVVSTGICGRYRKKAVVLLASNGPAPLRGGTTAKNDITISSSAFNISHVSPKTDADIIALKDFNINDFNNLKNKDNNSIKISSDSLSEDGKKITANNVEKKLPANVRHNSNPSIDETDLSGLNSLDKALEDSKISPNASLKSGTYVYIRDVTDSSSESDKEQTFTLDDENGAISLRDKNKWVYLDGDYDDIDIDVNQVDNYAAVQSVNGVSFGNGKVTVSENVATDGNIHFMALNKTEDGYSNGNSIDFELDDGSLIVGKSSSDDKSSLIVYGEVTGTGKIFATGDINMNAGSVFEARKQSGVGIWAGGRINVKNAENLSSDSAVQENVLLQAGLEHAVANGLTPDNTPIWTVNGKYSVTTTIAGTTLELPQRNVTFTAVPLSSSNDSAKPQTPNLNRDIEYPDILPGDSIESYLKRFYAFNVNNTSFKGTIYSAGNDIEIQTKDRDFELLGAFIAINGSILLSHINNGSLIFDPDYVPFFKNENYGVDTRILYLSVL